MWSLLDLMYEYKLGDLSVMFTAALSAAKDLGTADNLKKSLADADEEVRKKTKIREVCTPEWIANLATVMDGLTIVCKNFEPDASLLSQIEGLRNDLASGNIDRREAVLGTRLVTVLEGIQDNLNSRKFMFVPSDQAPFYDNPFLFGERFARTFPRKALFETIEAGRCYALGRWTACVFHCMRSAEYGLRRIAKKTGVALIDKGKPIPIEYATWDKIIVGIRNSVAEAKKLANTPAKEKKLQFYSQAADDCEYMKDIWRNEVSHARRAYQKAEALAVVSRVGSFLRLVAG
jgi:hypothetical protein